jgi:cellulose synthase (UDP-forming)
MVKETLPALIYPSMWYQNRRPSPVVPPNFKQKWLLRIMIIIGVASSLLFANGLLQEEYIGYKPLYYPLIFALLFMVFRISYEWYHYWHISVPETPELKRQYTVDILTTFVPGEPYDMVVETLEAIQKITYPHTSYLCDEGNDPYLIEQCKRLGVKHVTRKIKVNAKAGNINNALQQASGEICLILDPDHIPAPDFLDWVLPHFQDPEIGFVQSVQGYYNIYENIIAKGSAQQTFQFYGPIMMTMNSYGTAQAIGANCTFRRAALDSIGGHAPGLAEDMNTSMKLHGHGWKSTYVPRMLTRGLVPNTLSAYYQQQLKWSRGVFELLVTTYIENFRKLNFRQKIHYGILPWNYFTGFIYLINFLIPILSLLLGMNPMTMSLWNFMLLGIPFTASTLIIRHYVQEWVMEEDERGFHLQGGLMMIGTWWVHSLGFIFTVLRRKVPYNPTPKDGKEENIWALNIPNISIAALSIVAIAFGLIRDFNPYSFIMACFALMNVVFMTFMVLISMQNRYRRYIKKYAFANNINSLLQLAKDRFWKLRRLSYTLLRFVAAPLLVGIILLLYQQSSQKEIESIDLGLKPFPPKSHLLGSDYQHTNIGESSSFNLQKLRFDWYTPAATFSEDLNQIWANSQYPLLTWPDESLDSPYNLEQLCENVIAGKENARIDQFTKKVLKSENPILISFLPRFEASSENLDLDELIDLGEKYQKAWRYIYKYFRQSGLNNIAAVYHADNSANIDRFFPGIDYVDWLKTDLSEALSSSKPLFEGFHDLYVTGVYSLNLPVLLEVNQKLVRTEVLYQNYKYLCDSFAQIGGLIVTNPEVVSRVNTFPKALQQKRENPEASLITEIKSNTSLSKMDYTRLSGVNYYKGSDWQATQNPLFRKVLEDDFKEMNQLGLKTIKRVGPGFYDFNLLNQAEQSGHSIIYSFWTGNIKSFEGDQTELEELREVILSGIKLKMNEKSIVSWHIGSASWNSLSLYHNQPELSFERGAYLKWLKELTSAIKEIDSSRSISIEIDLGPFFKEDITNILGQLSKLSAIGINIRSSQELPLKELKEELQKLGNSVFISSCPAEYANHFKNINIGFLIEAWQDEIFDNKVAFNGLKTLKGKKKKAFLKLAKENPFQGEEEEVRIIAVVKPVISGYTHRYQALIKSGGNWRPLTDQDKFEYHWKLVKYNYNGEPIALKELTGSHVLDMIVPPKAYHYKLHLDLVKDGYARSNIAVLYPPLYNGPYLENVSRREIEAFLKNGL